MAKALLGHLGGPDPVVMAELARLRRRARDLEDEVERLHAANEALTALVAEDQLLSLTSHREPALTLASPVELVDGAPVWIDRVRRVG